MPNFRDGSLTRGQPLGMTVQQVTLSADNTRIDASSASLLLLTSDNATAANRTFLLNSSPLVGHELIIVLASASTACELANSGTCKLQSGWTPASQYQSIALVSDGTYWVEKSRSSLTSTGAAPAYVNVYAGTSASVAGATNSVTVTGALTTDVAIVTLNTVGATLRTILTSKVSATNTLQVVFSGDPSTDHAINYAIFRAV